MNIKKFDSINVVPFIDIMLVLLVMVLTTATFVAKGIIPVDLSEAKSSTKLKLKKEVIITIKKDGELFINENPVEIDSLKKALFEFDKKDSVYINCDKQSKFDHFVQVMDILKENGFDNLGVVAKK